MWFLQGHHVHSISWNALGMTFNKMCCLTTLRKTSFTVKTCAVGARPAGWHDFPTGQQKTVVAKGENDIVLLQSVLMVFVT